jgi:hypothetical protein
VFLLLAALKLWQGSAFAYTWLALSAAFAAVAWLRPSMGSDIETLVIGECLLEKHAQDPALKLDYKDSFELD